MFISTSACKNVNLPARLTQFYILVIGLIRRTKIRDGILCVVWMKQVQKHLKNGK
jgi:hypothetical protein